MPVMTDKSGNPYEYTTREVHGESICLDGFRFIYGTLKDFVDEVPADVPAQEQSAQLDAGEPTE